MEVQDVHVESAPDLPIPGQDRVHGVQHAFATLGIVNLTEVFAQRARVMQSVAMQEILARTEANSEFRATRGWKLLLLLPRMILFRPLWGGNVSRKKLESRIVAFHEGRWMELLRESTVAAETAHAQSVSRRRRQDHDDDARRAARAMTLAQMGELSAARPVPPGTMSTLRALTDPEKRLLCRVAGLLSVGQVPEAILPSLGERIRLRIVVQGRQFIVSGARTRCHSGGNSARAYLSKLDGERERGRVRGIVVGDVLRRSVARTIAKQVIEKVETATAPFQYAPSHQSRM